MDDLRADELGPGQPETFQQRLARAGAERRQSAGRRSGGDRRAGADRRRRQLPFDGPERRTGSDRREGIERRSGGNPRQGLLDTQSGGSGYQLQTRSQLKHPELYEPTASEFWQGISDEQRDALTRLQAVAMEKVGFEKGTPKFFIDANPGSQYEADDFFVGPERARVKRERSVAEMSDTEVAYRERRAEKRRWLEDKQNRRKRARHRESEADGGMNFFAAVRTEQLAADTELAAGAGRGTVAEYDGPSLLIGGMLTGAGLFTLLAGLTPMYVEEYASMLAKILPTAGAIAACFGAVIIMNHRSSG